MKIINMDTIVQDPNPFLRNKSEKVLFPLQKKDKETLLKMLEYVHNSRDDELVEKLNLQPAVGIAAPQIGINKQMTAIVVDLEDKSGKIKTHEYALINPQIISHSIKKVALAYGEGCLSVRKKYEGYVPRYKRIRVKAFDLLQNKEIELVARNELAIILQHEIDHLHGILFYDHINKENPWNKDDLEIID